MTTRKAQPIPPDQLNATRAAYLAQARDDAEAGMRLVTFILIANVAAVVFVVFLALWWIVLK